MNLARPQRRTRRAQDLPSEIYIPLVDSLYKDGRTLLAGSIFVIGSILLTYWKTGEILLLACALAFAIVGGARGIGMHLYARARATIRNSEEAGRWEFRYVVGAATSVALLGVWCFIAFAKTTDPLAHLVSFSMTIAYVIGIFGRNFGNSRFVVVQILCAGVPMIAALLLFGSIYHWLFAGLLIPFFMAVRFIAERLRNTLLDAVIATRDMLLLANRFDTALNNMPHGLCMFDADHRIVVSNGQMNELLGLPLSLELKGLNARQLAQNCVDFGMIAGTGATQFIESLSEKICCAKINEFLVEFRNGRTIEFALHPMENGGMVLLVEDITERKIAEAKINHMARYDELTGLPNRMVLHECVDKALANCTPHNPFALHFIDLDQFKQVNDTLGHSRGDMLLLAVADRLRPIVRESDVIARFGGDEFVVLQSPVNSVADASALAARIVGALDGAYEVDGHEVVVSASVGIAFAPKDGTNADQLLRNADMALYRAKAECRGTWRFFKSEMEADAQARRNLELDLRNALENDAFEIYYQPIFDLKTREIVACEALLRWPHPERGMIPPTEFIPVAEEMGLIVELGNQVLRKAALECKKWPSDIRVAVNLSPIQFSRGNIVSFIRETLAAADLSPDRLEIEITETTLLQNTRRNRSALHQLARLGVRISLDDFGTGYSSLSYLHKFPLHKVKIDQSFLQDLTTNDRRLILLRGMARLSTELGLRVAVEGIEREDQLAFLSIEGGVDEVQGFLFGMPMPSAEIRKRLYAAPLKAVRVA